jgi:hypothetical protein
MSDHFIAVRLDVHCEDDESATRACEALTRAMVGLALDGMTATVQAMTVPMDDEDERDGAGG